ncbi:unnamed protein product [Oikopleura dioica]|uniref:Major facilitator superfamily (MFS) profile domain-containing protein n=1 Tax=Oikopleura dioica TaxID=34765 RepID=E4XV55_OIKDI|nr:unnamed protein product [Oikopleura dioica]
MFIVHFFYGGLLKSLSIMYSPWQATFNVNNAEVAVIFSALATCMQCGAFASKFLQSFGQKVLFASSIIAFLGAFTAYLAKTLTTLAIGIGILGFALGIFRVRSISILSQNVTGGKRAFAISLGMVGTAVGATVLPLLWRFILYRYSTGQTMLILAGMLLNLFIATLCLKERSQTKEEKKNSEPDSIIEIFRLPVVLYCIAMLLNFSGKTAQFPFFVPFAESIGLSGYEPATIVLLINVVDIFSRPVGGQLGSSKYVQKIGGSILPIIFFILMALMNALALFTITDFLSYSIWAAIYGVVYAIPVPSTMSCICEFTHVKNMNNVLR